MIRDDGKYPTGMDLRRGLREHADALCEIEGTSYTAIGDEAVKDGKALSRILSGGNFTVAMYDRLMDYMAAQLAKWRSRARRTTAVKAAETAGGAAGAAKAAKPPAPS